MSTNRPEDEDDFSFFSHQLPKPTDLERIASAFERIASALEKMASNDWYKTYHKKG